MRLADEIDKINNQSKQIKDIREDINKLFEEMDK